jgi:hypothetical protein
MKLVLKIELGSDGMTDGADLAKALKQVAELLHGHGKGLKKGLASNIKNINGRTCGRWAIVTNGTSE